MTTTWDQLTITDTPEKFARPSDPATSHASAEPRPDLCDLVLAALTEHGPTGATRHQVTGTLRVTSWPEAELSSVSRRLTTLVRQGRAVDTGCVGMGPSGRPCTVFRAVHR